MNGDEYRCNCGRNHPHCQQEQVSHLPLQQASDADLLVVWPLLLIPAVPSARARLVRRRSASLLAAVSSTASVHLDCETRSWSPFLLAAVSSTISADLDCETRSWSAALLTVVSSTVSVDLDCEIRSWSASLLAAAWTFASWERDWATATGVPLALLLPPPASDAPFWSRISHGLVVFAVQPILQLYTERRGYASEEAPAKENIHPPSHNKKLGSAA